MKNGSGFRPRENEQNLSPGQCASLELMRGPDFFRLLSLPVARYAPCIVESRIVWPSRTDKFSMRPNWCSCVGFTRLLSSCPPRRCRWGCQHSIIHGIQGLTRCRRRSEVLGCI
jgi:hypothetical protein